MARSLNRFSVIGNVGQSVDFGVLPSGDPVANFSIAANEKWTDKTTGEVIERVDWFRCSVKGALVSVVERLVRSGTQLFIEGSVRTGSYERNGEMIPTFEINVSYMNVLTFDDAALQQPPQQQGQRQSQGQRQQQPRQQQGRHQQQPRQQQGRYQQQPRQQQGQYQQQGQQQARKSSQGGFGNHSMPQGGFNQ